MEDNKLLDKLSFKIGIVKNNADPAQLGRLQIFIPSMDSISYQVEDLPWALYVSPFAGTTANPKVGREAHDIPGTWSYGMWAIPKNGAQVLCGFLEGNLNMRFWLGCFHMPELNRTLPQGIDGLKTEIDETGSYPQAEIPYVVDNLTEAGLYKSDKNHKTRGGYERSITHPSNKTINKPTDNGYAPKPLELEKADSQGYCFKTPGGHFLYLSDVDTSCRIRLKTIEGTQIILDDTNERIYLSTAKGRNWIEIDETNGKMYFYTASKFSVHAENDINLYSDQNINIVAKKRVNIQSQERGVKIQGEMGIGLISNSNDIMLTASRGIHLKTLDGPNSSEISEMISNSLPPYAGSSLGLIRDFAEPTGSVVSSIFINGAESIEIKANSNNVNITSAETININAGGNIVESAANIHQNSFAADTANPANSVNVEDIKIKMIVPKHESWERDEDEKTCPTIRNSKYQG